MDKNFTVGQSNEIVCGGYVYDVHNRYDFSECRIQHDRRVRLAFTPNAEHAGERDTQLVLLFDEVDYVEVSPGFGTRPVRDLLEFGYKTPGDRDDSWLMTEEQSGPSDHLFIRLDSGAIRIHAAQARAVVRDLSAVAIHDQPG
jgi:hypothetical protein